MRAVGAVEVFLVLKLIAALDRCTGNFVADVERAGIEGDIRDATNAARFAVMPTRSYAGLVSENEPFSSRYDIDIFAVFRGCSSKVVAIGV